MNSNRLHYEKWWISVITAVISLIIVISGFFYYHHYEKIEKNERYQEIKAIADLKSSQISNWIKERKADAEITVKSPLLIDALSKLISQKDNNIISGYMESRIELLQKFKEYQDVFILDTNLKIITSTNNIENEFNTELVNIMIESIKKKDIYFSDFYNCEIHKTIHFDIVAPVIQNNKVLGLILFRVNPFQYLYPLIQSWPTNSSTAETLILRKDGDSVLFLNELRHSENTALKLKIPLTNTDIPAVKAVLGHKGIFEGKDYRGVEVLSDTRKIPKTDWYMITKVDRSEIYSHIKKSSLLISLIIIILVILSFVSAYLVYNNNKKKLYLQLNIKQKQLLEAQEEFKTTLYSIGDAVITTDRGGLIKQMNKVAEDLTGWSEKEAHGKYIEDVFNIINEDTRKKVDNPVELVLSSGKIVGLANHTVLISKDGKHTPIADSGAPIIDSNNNILGVVLVFRDQSDEILSKKKILESEAKYRKLFENANEGIFQTTIDGKYLSVNPALARMYGYNSPEEMMNDRNNIARDSYKNPEQRDYFVRKMIEDGFVDGFEYEVVQKDGNVVWFYEVANAVKDKEGNIEFFEGFVIDITEKKRFERELIETNQKVSTLFEAMTEMVVLHEIIFDDNGNPVNYKIEDCNKAFSKITGIEKSTAIGRLATEVYGTNDAPYLDIYSQVAVTGIPYTYETYFPPMEKHFSISVVSPKKNKFATITTDITSLKQIQQIINAKNKELEQIVYVASHDLRSPLVNVDGYSRELKYSIQSITSILTNCDPSSYNETIKTDILNEIIDINESLNHIQNSTRQMDGLLKGLLKLSRLGRAALSIEVIDMNNLISGIVSTYDYQIKSTNSEIIISDLPSCKGDVVQITQLLSNLLSNALKFLDSNRKGQIKIYGRIEYGKSIYCVEDNGIGIAAAHQDNIFELFHRLEPNKTEGEGLGLTIVKQILSRLDGDIKVESIVGEGSRFFVYLPYQQIIKK